MRLARQLIIATLACCLLAGSTVIVFPDVRWRVQVIVRKVGGELDEVSWPRLLQMLAPGSGYWLEPFAESGTSIHSMFRNPHNSPEDVIAGERLFRSQCSTCHLGHGGASSALDLTDEVYAHGASDWAIFTSISNGIPGTAMQPSTLGDRKVWQIVSHIRATSIGQVDDDQDRQSPQPEIGSVIYERLVHAEKEPENWLMYSGTYSGQRFSRLAQINPGNVDSLKIDWVYQFETNERIGQSTPLVVDETIFLTVSPDQDVALDARSGEVIWSKRRSLPSKLSICCGPHNRGMAVYRQAVYRGTLDAHLIARDVSTGELLWDVEVGQAAAGYSITAAPLAVEDMIITGVAGGEFGIRGHLDAYDWESGELIWRFNTIPGPNESGNDTWSGDSWRTGGGPTWMTGAYDPELRLVYWGIGNPAPDFNGDDRLGDNLYTNSIVALDVDSGRLQWHFQFTPHDLHDFDANQVPVLVDMVIEGREKKLLLTANKNGFAYVLDRETGEYLLGHEVVQQTWAKALDSRGRPIVRDESRPTKAGTIVRPAAVGGANWWPPSYSAFANVVYYSVVESANVYFKNDVDMRDGELFMGSGATNTAGAIFHPYLRAYRAGTDELVWEYAVAPGAEWPAIGGSLSLAGGLLALGEKDGFVILDSETGEMLKHVNLGAPTVAAPISYVASGKQRIAVVAGRSLYSFSISN
jgi:alcohol dehydrogenase (cytochrome c)